MDSRFRGNDGWGTGMTVGVGKLTRRRGGGIYGKGAKEGRGKEIEVFECGFTGVGLLLYFLGGV